MRASVHWKRKSRPFPTTKVQSMFQARGPQEWSRSPRPANGTLSSPKWSFPSQATGCSKRQASKLSEL